MEDGGAPAGETGNFRVRKSFQTSFVCTVQSITGIEDYGKHLTQMLEWDTFIPLIKNNLSNKSKIFVFFVENCQDIAVRRIFSAVRRILVRNQKLYDRMMGKWQKAGKGDYQIAERRDDRIRTDEENVAKFLTMGGFYT